MPSIANRLTDSIKGQYFRHAHTGLVIEACELVYPNSGKDPNEKFILARNPMDGKFLAIPYREIVEYLTLSKTEAVSLTEHLQGHSERLLGASNNVASQYLSPP